MISHIFRIIWAERRINLWILLELVLVFTVLWFCSEYIFVLGKHYMEPKGYDLNHTYVVNFGIKKNVDTSTDTPEDKEAQIDNIYNLIKSYPGVESAVLTEGNYPYGPTWRSKNRFIVNGTDTLTENRYTVESFVKTEYFDVFRMKLQQGKLFKNEDAITNESAVISPDYNSTFMGFDIGQVRTIQGGFDIDNNYFYEKERKVAGIVEPIKFIDIEPYYNIAFYPINSKMISPTKGICIRVLPDADKEFADRFMKDMHQRLEIGPYFLASVSSMKDIRDNYMKAYKSYNDNLRSVSSITFFLIVNMFLGIVGTFWFRVQSRRGDIGLRIALGATRKAVKGIYITEAIILLFIASVIATLLCINISAFGVLSDIGMPNLNKEFFNLGNTQYIINYLVTFAILVLITLVAVWVPAKKASDVQPVEALRDE